MPFFGPISRKYLVYYLKKTGFNGPYAGGKHQFMKKGYISLPIPNPHQGDIGKELLSRILRQAEISKEEWENL